MAMISAFAVEQAGPQICQGDGVVMERHSCCSDATDQVDESQDDGSTSPDLR